MVVELFGTLGCEVVTQLGGLQEGDGVRDTEGECAVAVGYASKGKVSQSVDDIALADTSAVEVILGHGEFRFGIAGAHLGELCADAMGKAVVVVKGFL